ncbi:hypothetical protein [Modestobacter lapidis]
MTNCSDELWRSAWSPGGGNYAIAVNGAITGYIEVKKPGASVDPDSFTGHNKRQWERQRDLPNLIYTNGTEWRL